MRAPGFFAQAAALYWQAEEEGLNYAIQSSSTDRPSDSRIKSPDFDWDFGFKVGLGYRVPHDRWDLLLQFTSFQTHTDVENKAKHGDVYLPVWEKPGLVTDFAKEVKMHWRLHMGLLDLLLRKDYVASKTLILTPQIGIRYGMVRQKFNIDYRGGSFSSEGDSIRMKNKYWGIGPSLGMSGEWSIACGFSLFAEGAFSVLYGEFYVHQDEKELESKEKLLGVHSIFRSPASIVDAAAGLRWQHCFSSRLKRMSLELGWDQLLLFSQNQLMRFTDGNEPGLFVANQGDLSIAGVQFNVRLDF